jgi:hypothetical protein
VSEPFLFSVPSGEAVVPELFHYCIIGQTQFSGKTTLVKRLAVWAAEQGYRVLIFDTKETEADYAGFGEEVPICLRQSRDSFALLELLESIYRRKITQYYGVLSRLAETCSDYDQIIEKSASLEAKQRDGWLKDALKTLHDLFVRLKEETSKVKTVSKLQLHDGINRMVINKLSLEAQQLVVKNSFEDALTVYREKLILVLDEAFKFIPQGYASAATRAIMNVMTQGAKTGLFAWISTQFLAPTDKDPLKAAAIKFLGTQDQTAETKHTLALIPEARGKFTSDDIMKLKRGHWILVRKSPYDVRTVYLAPVGVPANIGVQVAQGKLTPEDVRDRYLRKAESNRREVDDEAMWQSKFQELEAKYRELEKKYQDNIAAFEKVGKEVDKKNQELHQENMMLLLGTKKLTERLQRFEALETALKGLGVLGQQPQPANSGQAPSAIKVSEEQPSLTVTVQRTLLELNGSTVEGKIAILYAQGSLPTKQFTNTDLNELFEQHFGDKQAPANLARACDKFTAWGYFEKVKAGARYDYRVKLDPKEAKKKGLLTHIEK